MKDDVVKLDWFEAHTAAYIIESFVEDHSKDEADLKMQLTSHGNAKFAKDLARKLERFTDIETRCGVIGPGNSLGDHPRCVRKSQGHKGKHCAFDIGLGKVQVWDKPFDYVGNIIEHAMKPGSGMKVIVQVGPSKKSQAPARPQQSARGRRPRR